MPPETCGSICRKMKSSSADESEASSQPRAIVAGHGDFPDGMVSAVEQISGRGGVFIALSNKGLSGGFVTQPNQDIVAEFTVNTLSVSAQYGSSAGSITNMVTKSGSNDFHGDVYEYVRNDRFDATDFFTNQGGAKKTEPKAEKKPGCLNLNLNLNLGF